MWIQRKTSPPLALSHSPRSVCSAHFSCHNLLAQLLFPGAIFIMLYICITKGVRDDNLKKGEWPREELCKYTSKIELTVQNCSQQDVWYFDYINSSGTASGGVWRTRWGLKSGFLFSNLWRRRYGLCSDVRLAQGAFLVFIWFTTKNKRKFKVHLYAHTWMALQTGRLNISIQCLKTHACRTHLQTCTVTGLPLPFNSAGLSIMKCFAASQTHSCHWSFVQLHDAWCGPQGVLQGPFQTNNISVRPLLPQHLSSGHDHRLRWEETCARIFIRSV